MENAAGTHSCRVDIAKEGTSGQCISDRSVVKGIGPVVNTLTAAGIARPVAELTPFMTIKG